MTALMSPQQYMDVLLDRQAAYEAEHPPVGWVRTLPTWFIRDGDEHLVDMAAIERANAAVEKPPTRPRYYRPASHWRGVIERTQARMDAINGVQRHDTTDPAAYGGLGIHQTPRQQRRYGARIDNAASEYVRLDGRIRHARSMLRKAEEREQ